MNSWQKLGVDQIYPGELYVLSDQPCDFSHTSSSTDGGFGHLSSQFPCSFSTLSQVMNDLENKHYHAPGKVNSDFWLYFPSFYAS